MQPEIPQRSNDGSSRSAERVIQILELIALSSPHIALPAIAEQTGIAKSTAHRILKALEGHEMVQREMATHRYQLGPRAAQIGAAALNGLDVRAASRPHMERLRKLTRETVGLNIRFGSVRYYVEQLESPHELKAKAELGRPYPLWAGAPGRALILDSSDEELDELLKHVEVRRYTATTPITRSAIQRRLAEARRLSFVIASEEVMAGVRTIAAPVRDHTCRVVAALSISGPTSRFTRGSAEQVSDKLLNESQALSKRLGCHN